MKNMVSVLFAGLIVSGFAMQANAQAPKAPKSVNVDVDCNIAEAIQKAELFAVISAENFNNWKFPKAKFCKEGKSVELLLIPLEQDMPAPKVLAMLDRKGLRAAELPELLALASKRPELQRSSRIFALGSAKVIDVGYIEYGTPFLGVNELGPNKGKRMLSIWHGPECPAGFVVAVRK